MKDRLTLPKTVLSAAH